MKQLKFLFLIQLVLCGSIFAQSAENKTTPAEYQKEKGSNSLWCTSCTTFETASIASGCATDGQETPTCAKFICNYVKFHNCKGVDFLKAANCEYFLKAYKKWGNNCAH